MDKTLKLEEKIKNILDKEFVLDGNYSDYFHREAKFVHKSGKAYFNVLIERYRGRERITSIILYKEETKNNLSRFLKNEEYSFNFFEEQEYTLKKLKAIKTKFCLTQVFLEK